MADPLSQTFAALADPTRRAILARLAEGEATVNTLAEPFEMSVQAISRHLKVLEASGLITRGKKEPEGLFHTQTSRSKDDIPESIQSVETVIDTN